ncbi:MAG: hypothetical protein EOP78_10325 [Variovorax sp.]|nr:MAG: hypothetical protein EOP78_10325 [Variovorax sp.]
MKNSQILSAVVVSAAALQAGATVAPSTGANVNGALPAVFRFQATGARAEPERLVAYERALAADTGFTLAMRKISGDDLGPCGTVSGSRNDWDDSAQDC